MVARARRRDRLLMLNDAIPAGHRRCATKCNSSKRGLLALTGVAHIAAGILHTKNWLRANWMQMCTLVSGMRGSLPDSKQYGSGSIEDGAVSQVTEQ